MVTAGVDAGERAGLCFPVVVFYCDLGSGHAEPDVLIRHAAEDVQRVVVYMSFLGQGL